MPIPVKSNCRTRSMTMPGERKEGLAAVDYRPQAEVCLNDRHERATALIQRRFERSRPLHRRKGAGPLARSIVELDMLVEDDGPLFVPHDVVTVQTVAVLVEIIFAFGTREFFQRKNGLADFSWVVRARLVD